MAKKNQEARVNLKHYSLMMSSLSLKIAAFSVYTSNSYILIAQYPV